MSEKTPEEVFEERERLFEIMARGRLSMRLPDSPWETILPEVQGAWMADMCAGVDALDAAGYVIVPKEPTREMNAAFEDAPQTARGAVGADDIFFIRFCERYRSMIAAA